MADILSGLTSLVGGSLTGGIADIIKLFKVDPNLVLQNQEKLAEINAAMQGKIVDGIASQNIAQAEVNKSEAASGNMFVAGWRPAIGWVCALALGFQFIVAPFATWGVSIYAAHTGQHLSIPFPTLDMGTLLTLLLGMLGLGGMRTFEKVNGVPDSQPTKGGK